jgi:hypothetical protein
MKITKTSWLILGVGVFIIVLVALGLTRSGQIKAQDSLRQQLSVSNTRIGNVQVNGFQMQINELQEQLKVAQEQSSAAQDRLKQKIISVDVTDKFYEIAGLYGVTVNNIGTTSITRQPYASINCDIISLNANVSGAPNNVINFITGLNDNYSTGFVRSVQLDSSDNSTSQISIQMIVYSIKENK